MNHEKDYNSSSSSIEGAKQYDRRNKLPAHPIYGEGMPFRWEDIYQTGLNLCREQKWESALPWLEAAYFHYPEFPDTTFLLSLAQARLGLINESKSTATTLEDAGPSCVKTRLQLCWLSLETRDWESSREHLKAVIGTNLHPVLIWTIQVMADLQSLGFDQALKRCQQAQHETDHPSNQIETIGGLHINQGYDVTASKLVELFRHQLNSEVFTDSKKPSLSDDHLSLKLEDVLPSETTITPIDHSKDENKLAQIRVESDFRKRFWIRERMLMRQDTPHMVLQELPPSPHPMTVLERIPLPIPLRPTFPNAPGQSRKPSSSTVQEADRYPFGPYNWLSIRQPWQDEETRLERWATASMKSQKAQSSFWTLTASHPERIVGLGSLTPRGDREGHISVSVNPLVAHHRQETNLFITLLQKARQMRLIRLTAMVEQDSLEDQIIRRNGFRIVHEEETLEIPLGDWNLQRDPPSIDASLSFELFTRAFVEDDWSQIMELILNNQSSTTPSTVHWKLPNETTMIPGTFNPHLSTVIKHRNTMIGALLVKIMPNKCLHVFLCTHEHHSPVDEDTLIKSLLHRFLTLANKKGFLTVCFKRRIEHTNKTIQKTEYWKNKGTVLMRTRALAREEINP